MDIGRSERGVGLGVAGELRQGRSSAGDDSREDGPEEGREAIAVRLCVWPRGDVVHGGCRSA